MKEPACWTLRLHYWTSRGYEIPETMQGRSLVAGMEKKGAGGGSDEESRRIVHDRLAGLGYV